MFFWNSGFKGLGLIDRVPDELWTEVRDIVQKTGIKTIPMEKKYKKAKWLSEEALQSITTNKASGGDGIPVELFRIRKDDAVKVLHSTCQQIWKTQQWPQDWKRSVFILIPKKGNAKAVQTTAQLHSSHMLAK